MWFSNFNLSDFKDSDEYNWAAISNALGDVDDRALSYFQTLDNGNGTINKSQSYNTISSIWSGYSTLKDGLDLSPDDTGYLTLTADLSTTAGAEYQAAIQKALNTFYSTFELADPIKEQFLPDNMLSFDEASKTSTYKINLGLLSDDELQRFNETLEEQISNISYLIDMVEELKDVFNLYSVDENGIVTQPLTVDELQTT